MPAIPIPDVVELKSTAELLALVPPLSVIPLLDAEQDQDGTYVRFGLGTEWFEATFSPDGRLTNLKTSPDLIMREPLQQLLITVVQVYRLKVTLLQLQDEVSDDILAALQQQLHASLSVLVASGYTVNWTPNTLSHTGRYLFEPQSLR